MQVTLADIHRAKNELTRYLTPTPLIYNAWLSEALGCEVHLKLENMQPIGSFKIRGATYKISQLTAAQKAKGVLAASAGNHAQGVAWGSRKLGVKATIFMPKGAALVKVQNTRNLGAEVVLTGETFEEAFAAAYEAEKKTGSILVHAYEDPLIIAGQGTTGLEILDQLPDVDVIISSIGGGGLLTGIAIAAKELDPRVRIVGCQSSGADAMVQSFKAGKAVQLERAITFADGIAVAGASEVMRALLAPRMDDCIGADDESIAAAVLMLIEKAKVVSEGSGAVPLAALSLHREKFAGKKVVLVISGGNIDVNLLARIIDRGLIRAGRRVRVNVTISDRTGSLARLTDLIARQGANVLQAIHDRSEPSTTIDQTEVALTLETRGPEHSAELITALRGHVLRLELAH